MPIHIIMHIHIKFYLMMITITYNDDENDMEFL